MRTRDLIRFGRREGLPARVEDNPFLALRAEMDHLFDRFWRDFPLMPFEEAWAPGMWAPNVDVVEAGNGYRITAELPGMERKDVEVSIREGLLTIAGEKKAEETRKEKGYAHMERCYGTFRRTIRLPEGVVTDKVDATFKNGILTITLPRAEVPKVAVHKVEVKEAA